MYENWIFDEWSKERLRIDRKKERETERVWSSFGSEFQVKVIGLSK